MKLIQLIKKGIRNLNNQEIELRIRMLFFLEYAALVACIVGTIAMIAFAANSFEVLIPNIIIFIICVIGLYLSHYKKQYDLAAFIIVCICDYLAFPYMFFTAGGNRSGMPMWLLFGIIFTCMMMKGKLRIVMPIVSIIVAAVCMLIGNCRMDWVKPLANPQVEFTDMFQSFILVSIVVFISLIIYLSSYDKQRIAMEKSSEELKKAMSTDPLTGVPNRHALYEESATYKDSGYIENLTLVTLDINGLKSVNDTYGHAAGDELIVDASKVLMNAFSKFGKLYRTGGDEFVALLFCNDSEAEQLHEILNTAIKVANENNGTNIAIAIGVAVWNQNKAMSFFELSKLADTNMYKNKSEFYRSTGRDRRKR